MEAFSGEPDGTREAIMHATYLALCEHGYAELTIDGIGDCFEKSPSLIYHHYDGKDDLLLDFLEFMLEEFETAVVPEPHDDAQSQLHALLDHLLPASFEPERAAFTRAISELRAQAAHDERYRAQVRKSNRLFHDRIAAIVRHGIDNGEFRAIDADQTAELLLTTINGAMMQRVTTDDSAPIRAVRTELDEYIDSRLLCTE